MIAILTVIQSVPSLSLQTLFLKPVYLRKNVSYKICLVASNLENSVDCLRFTCNLKDNLKVNLGLNANLHF